MSSQFVRRVRVTDDLRAYESFYDHPWAKELGGYVQNANLFDIYFDLCIAWKGISNTYRLPWLMPETAKHFYDSYMAGDPILTAEIANRLTDQLVSRMRDALPGTARGRLKKVVRQLAAEVNAQRASRAGDLDVINELWTEMIKADEFRLSLWATQRICYGAIYFAYEDALIRCIKLLKGVSRFRISQRPGEFEKEFTQLYDAMLFRECWDNEQLQIARLTRHALAHNGGRVTADLQQKNHNLPVDDGQIHILAEHTRGLFDLLKQCASKLIRATQTKLG